MLNLNKEDKYWLAGLLEGEGSFCRGSPSNPRAPRIAVEMIDKDIVKKVARLFGCKCIPVSRRESNWHSTYIARRVGKKAVELIDEHIVGPILKRLKSEGDNWRILVLPDHPTPCTVRTHTSDPVPIALAGKRLESLLTQTFTENDAAESDLHIPRGCELMEYFLTVR